MSAFSCSRIEPGHGETLKRQLLRVTVAWLAVCGLFFRLVYPSCLRADDGAAPVVIRPCDIEASLVVLPDGTWETYSVRADENGSSLFRSRSFDEGRTWSETDALCKLAIQGRVLGSHALLDRRGEAQLFVLVLRTQGSGQRIAVDRFIDIWYLRSSQGRTQWSKPQRIFKGYVGSLRGALQLRSGRILLPFAYWVAGRALGPPTGAHLITILYSDDEGATWKQSPARLTAPCHDGYNGINYGAIEPTILQLKDGRVWMLMRTQTGYLYETFSPDGLEWSEARPSRFHSSTSPSFLLRTGDGHIVLFWNNCEQPARVDGDGVYGGRDVLHAAISADDGKSWRGFREVYRDPFRNAAPPHHGDRGTAYPFAVSLKDGRIALTSGQGADRRALIFIDPAWLTESGASDDFSHGLGGWCTFKSFGPARGWWRDRTEGARLIDDPAKTGTKVLHLCKPDDKPADGAVWNFPSGRQGNLMLRLQIKKGSEGAGIALLDRFFDPTDDRVPAQAMFYLPIDAKDHTGLGKSLTTGEWHALLLAWDLDSRSCQVKIDGTPAGSLPLNASARNGISYLHLRSLAAHVDRVGFLIDSVSVVVGKD